MKFRLLTLVFACAAGGAWAWQEAYTRLNLNRETFERHITNYVHEAVRTDGHFSMPPLPGSKIVLALSDEARASLVRECGLAAKAFVMSPAFQAAYDAHIKNVYRAVNHGIQVSSAGASMDAAMKKGDYAAAQAATSNMMRDNFRKGVIQRLPSLANYDKGTIEMMAGVDANMMEMSNPSTPAEKAAVAKAKAMLEEAKKLAGTDVAKARETYKAALMTGAGLQDEAQVKSSAEDDRRREEQENYNRWSLRPNLKKKLLAFAAVVKTVDFNAATTMKDGKRVFVNRAYEGRDEFWKMLYRLGPGGANAAAQIAQQWAAEL